MTDWIRTTKALPCPVCQKDSWCILNQKLDIVICMRETSPRVKRFKDGSMGWLHPLNKDRTWTLNHIRRAEKISARPTINCRQLIETWTKTTKPEWVLRFSQQLRVSVYALRSMQICWSFEHKAWAFPMKDGYDNMVGIRLRTETGHKFAVRGSHQGCFIPLWFPEPLALVAEGPTDTCAGLDLGFFTVGRPCCSGGIQQLHHFFKRVGVKRAAIICDNDDPGVRGAQLAQEHFGVETSTIVLPTKDLREFVQSGGDKALMETYLQTAVWRHE